MKKYVLHTVKEERNIPHIIKRRKANWIGHILRRNCRNEGKIEGRIKVTGRRGKRRKQLLDDLKEKRGHWKLKEEALYRTAENSLFKRQETCYKTDYGMNEYMFDVLFSLQKV
jgi:hypothetical protein